MITLKTCPVCKSRNFIKYPEIGTNPHVMCDVMPGVSIETAIITHYFVCQDCHVIFQNPRMSDEELGKFYGKGYYRLYLNMTDEVKDNDEMHRAKVDSRTIMESIGKINSHLDIGCSRGYLLELVGADVKVGVETDVDNVTTKGVKVYREISGVPPKSFDLVTAIHVLEHVPDPIKYLKDMIKKVSKNGHLVIEVPTWKSPGGPLRLPHLFHFEPDVLRLLCREVGLRVIETKFTPHLLLICQAN